MLRFAKSCVGKPFSGTAMARSVLWPRRTNGTSFFCAGTARQFHTPFVSLNVRRRRVCLRRTRRRRVERGRVARPNLQPRRGDAAEPARAVPRQGDDDGQPVLAAAGKLPAHAHDQLGRARAALHTARAAAAAAAGSGAGRGVPRGIRGTLGTLGCGDRHLPARAIGHCAVHGGGVVGEREQPEHRAARPERGDDAQLRTGAAAAGDHAELAQFPVVALTSANVCISVFLNPLKRPHTHTVSCR